MFHKEINYFTILKRTLNKVSRKNDAALVEMNLKQLLKDVIARHKLI